MLRHRRQAKKPTEKDEHELATSANTHEMITQSNAHELNEKDAAIANIDHQPKRGQEDDLRHDYSLIIPEVQHPAPQSYELDPDSHIGELNADG